MNETLPIDRFAAALAHKINPPHDPVVKLNPGSLVVWILDALAGRYADSLLGYSLYSDRMSRDEAALRYLEAVLERALILVRDKSHSVAHELLLALCRRLPSPAWEEATLSRFVQAPSDAILFGESRFIAERAAALPRTFSKGSTAANRRVADGALYLCSGAIAIELPDELSVWGAIWVGPRSMKRIDHRPDFNVLCSVIIEALRTTHRPFQALCGLGHRLCPFDWLNSVSTSQVRAVSALQKQALLGHSHFVNVFVSATLIRDVWSAAPVPGYSSANAFLESDFGRALRGSSPVTRVNVPAESGPEGLDRLLAKEGHYLEDQEAKLLNESEFIERISEFVHQGVLSESESDLAMAIFRGDRSYLDAQEQDRMIKSITRKLKLIAAREHINATDQ